VRGPGVEQGAEGAKDIARQVLLIGASGFIGSAILARLAAAGVAVTAVGSGPEAPSSRRLGAVIAIFWLMIAPPSLS